MKAIGYLRVSGAGQVDGDGEARQEAAVKAFCASFGLDYQGHRFEKAVSGTVEGVDRPEFSEILAAPPEAIVVERMDRLARDLMVSEFLLAECRKRGIKVYAADQGALIDMASDGGDPTRVLIRQVLGALAQWEKSALVKKLRAARVRAAEKNGGRCEGNKPYGYFPSEQAVLRVVKQLAENTTRAQIADTLNAAGYLTRYGKAWSKEAVRNIVTGRKLKHERAIPA